ncbi:MAG: transporter substrate-binding domain-containing protein, partial [Erysipelotrichaceae bacterium]|nr:transporter substrate-binding domain-containing protein [Erysipelotrichaceae bacterium]
MAIDPRDEIRRSADARRGIFHNDMTMINVLLTVVTICLNILVIYILFYTTRFSALDKGIFTKINLAVMAVLLIIDILVWLSIRTKKIAVFITAVAALVISTAVGAYGAYAVTKVDTNLEVITAKEHDTDINISLVVYTKSSGDVIMDIEDLNGKKVGAVDGTDAAAIGKGRLEAEGITVNYQNYLSFAETFKALVTEEIDCAILPANYANAIGTEEQLEPFIVDTSAILTFKESVVQTGTDGAEKDLTSEPFTVLITGENEGLADSIIVVSVNPVSMKVTMTSIARDSFVPITC